MSKKNKIDIEVALNEDTLKNLKDKLKEVKGQLATLAGDGEKYGKERQAILDLSDSIDRYKTALDGLEGNSGKTRTFELAEAFTELGSYADIASSGMDALQSTSTMMDGIFGKNSEAAKTFSTALNVATQAQNFYNVA